MLIVALPYAAADKWAHLQPEGLLHVRVCRHFSMFVVSFMFACVCVCCLGGVLLCVREEREWLLHPGTYGLYRLSISPLSIPSSGFLSLITTPPPPPPPLPRLTESNPIIKNGVEVVEGGREEGEEKGKGISLQPPLSAAVPQRAPP